MMLRRGQAATTAWRKADDRSGDRDGSHSLRWLQMRKSPAAQGAAAEEAATVADHGGNDDGRRLCGDGSKRRCLTCRWRQAARRRIGMGGGGTAKRQSWSRSPVLVPLLVVVGFML